jgi:hypothetical protein
VGISTRCSGCGAMEERKEAGAGRQEREEKKKKKKSAHASLSVPQLGHGEFWGPGRRNKNAIWQCLRRRLSVARVCAMPVHVSLRSGSRTASLRTSPRQGNFFLIFNFSHSRSTMGSTSDSNPSGDPLTPIHRQWLFCVFSMIQ